MWRLEQITSRKYSTKDLQSRDFVHGRREIKNTIKIMNSYFTYFLM
jgi:hypothetical protein